MRFVHHTAMSATVPPSTPAPPTGITAPEPIPAPVATATPRAADGQLSPVGASALVVGSIVGVGIFNLPSSLSSYGPITIVSMGLATVGALALAWLFSSLARRMPAPGGPYAYARTAFGNRLGFANAWSYWITAWAGNAAIAVGWVLYVEVFVNQGQTKLWTILLVLGGLWVPALINLTGLKNTGGFQLATTITKFIALVFMSVVGLFYIRSANFTPFNLSGHSAVSAVGSGMAIALFSYLGLEVASVAAAKVRDRRPQRASGHHARDHRQRGRVHAVARRRVRGRLQPCPAAVHRALLHRHRRHVRGHGVGQGDGRSGHCLGHRRPQRLDDDHRRDAARRRGGRVSSPSASGESTAAAPRPGASSSPPRWHRSPS